MPTYPAGQRTDSGSTHATRGSQARALSGPVRLSPAQVSVPDSATGSVIDGSDASASVLSPTVSTGSSLATAESRRMPVEKTRTAFVSVQNDGVTVTRTGSLGPVQGHRDRAGQVGPPRPAATSTEGPNASGTSVRATSIASRQRSRSVQQVSDRKPVMPGAASGGGAQPPSGHAAAPVATHAVRPCGVIIDCHSRVIVSSASQITGRPSTATTGICSIRASSTMSVPTYTGTGCVAPSTVTWSMPASTPRPSATLSISAPGTATG